MSDQESMFVTILNAKGIYKFNEKQIIRKNAKKYFLYIPFNFLLRDLKTEIPLSQRTKVEERVEYFNLYIEEEYKKTKEIPDLNVLSIGFFKNSFYILDGQHRFSAISSFYEKNKKAMKDYYVMTTFYLIDTKKEFKQIMSQINNNFVSEEYLFQITEDDGDEELIEDKKEAIKNYMEKNYKIYLSEKLNCRPPFINLSILCEYLFNLYPKMSSYKMMLKIEQINKELEEEYKKTDIEFYHRIQGFIENKKDMKLLFLGKILNEEARIKLETMKQGRIRFTKALRKKLWSLYFKDETHYGQCFNCGCEKLKMSEYHISHKQSIKNGGTNEVANLIILCSTCNTSIGGTNLYDHPQVSQKDIEERIERVLKIRNQMDKDEDEEEEKMEKKKPVKKTIKKEESNVLIL